MAVWLFDLIGIIFVCKKSGTVAKITCIGVKISRKWKNYHYRYLRWSYFPKWKLRSLRVTVNSLALGKHSVYGSSSHC